ncbi:hypothetical protein D3218_14515 [Aureimonas flava]|uniref:Uncharacterized protein n=1 Tax=Aureimonas flava TaxID=2320271 RepID=A0A3A1WIX6_9HYPH|nr:hypothetical protein D3218_14515 [Aureimonas flava]
MRSTDVRFGELHRVGQEVDEHLPQPRLVAAHRVRQRAVGVERDADARAFDLEPEQAGDLRQALRRSEPTPCRSTPLAVLHISRHRASIEQHR